MLIKVGDLIKNEKCPICGEDIIIQLDTDYLRTWIHQIWRICSCDIIITQEGIFEKEDCLIAHMDGLNWLFTRVEIGGNNGTLSQ